MKTAITAILLAVSFVSAAIANPLYLETDALIDVVGGTSVHMIRGSTFAHGLSLGAGLMEITVPRSMYDEYPDETGKGWRVHLTGVRLLGDYRLSGREDGVTLGVHLAYDCYHISRLGGSSKFRQLGEALRFGYFWRPGNNKFYIMPLVYLLNSRRVSGSNEVYGEKFDANFLGFQAAVAIGYRFFD